MGISDQKGQKAIHLLFYSRDKSFADLHLWKDPGLPLSPLFVFGKRIFVILEPFVQPRVIVRDVLREFLALSRISKNAQVVVVNSPTTFCSTLSSPFSTEQV